MNNVQSIFQKKCFGLLPKEDEQVNKSASLHFSSLLVPTGDFKKVVGNQKEALLKAPSGSHDSCQVPATEGTAQWQFRSNAAHDKIIALSPTGEVYVVPAEVRVEFAANCKIGNDDLRFNLDAMNNSSLMLGEQILVSIPFEEDEKFAFEHLDYVEVSQCSIQGKGIVVLKSRQVANDDSMYKVVFKGYDVQGISTPILLFPVEKAPTLEIKIVELGQSKRAIQLTNETEIQIFGIEFVCDKPISMNIKGTVVKPVKTSDGQWAHSFLDPTNEQGRLLPSETMIYEFISDETPSSNKPISCTINSELKFKIEARP